MFPTPPSAHRIQTAIVGAGILGLSVARALSRKGHEILLLERSDRIGSGISSRNSEVIHAGIYYDPNDTPLKSRWCVEGKRLLYEYCRERDVPFRRCGKLLVATDPHQRDVELPRWVQRAKRNGVHDLKIVSKEQIADPHSDFYEPNVACEGGIYSPSTGIVDSHALMTALLAEAEERGALLALRSRVQGGKAMAGDEGSILLTVDGEDIKCDNVVVCAGLHSDRIASDIVRSSAGYHGRGGRHDPIPKQYYAKGNYFRLANQASPFTRLIYPLPDPNGGLGVHATIDLSGSTRFGPDVEWIPHGDAEDPDGIDANVDPDRAQAFYDAVR